MNTKFYLNDNWKLKIARNSDKHSAASREIYNKWIPATVPGTIHTDLLKTGIIKDPFKEGSEYKLEWISRSKCKYKTEFDYPAPINKSLPVKLVFEGIDTIAEIYLNKRYLGCTENMFVKYEFNVTHSLKHGKNILELHFQSPLEVSKNLAEKYGKSFPSDSSRVYIRKAQYSFGWDWGPAYPTMGIWRPVYLLTEDIAVVNQIKFVTEKITRKKAYITISFNVHLHTKKQLEATISLEHNDRIFRKKINIKKQNTLGFIITDPNLWWPNGQGIQNLYDMVIEVTDGAGKILDRKSSKVGIRKIELQLIENSKPTFRFRINNKPVFIRGMNWIPADSFLPRVPQKKYRQLLTLAKNANANMIRVWGGGVYESDEFYEICDELGLLVWQDFMFACGFYPEKQHFIDSVSEEVVQNVERLMNHPCIAIWCGNNENEWIWSQESRKPVTEMPGYKIFHKIIPRLIKKTGTLSSYWPTSPFGDDEDPNSPKSGNRHQWDIWSNWTDYSKVKEDQSLFVTEFGFQAPANLDTFNKFVPAGKREIQSPTFEYYNKQIEGPERVIRFLSAHLPLKTGWDDFIYLAQLNQGFALKSCVEHWRTNANKTNGAIIWQLNDCWPVTSWSLIDSELRPKISYYFVKNVFSKEIIYFQKYGHNLKINFLNELKQEELVFKAGIIDLKSGKYLFKNSKKISPGKRRYIELDDIDIKKIPQNKDWIILATLYDSKKKMIHRNVYMEKEWKHISLPEARIKFKSTKKDGMNSLVLSTDKPAFFIDVYYPGITFDDRGFILLPGEEKHLHVIEGKSKTIEKSIIKIFCLNDYLDN